jgi:histidyl-tRNA synthetase
MSLQSPRGTHDLLPELQAKHNLIGTTAREVAQRFGFFEMSTPIFEFSDVFKRTLGEASDIVNKEMYTFQDRNGEELTLRPEGTAGVARAFISEGLSQRAPLKLFYNGPMFRYERPQKGRQRQFHQCGVELLGAASPFADAECLATGYQFLKQLKVADLCTLEINSIGDDESRKKYLSALVQFLKAREDRLSPDSRRRLSTNPLRILDSKDPKDHELLQSAPLIRDFYNPTSKTFFETVCAALIDFEIPFTVNPFLVRGLDYYTHCVFEFKTTQLGAQDAVLSGGRYDQLIKLMGGPDTPGVGWAAGIERLAMLSPLEPVRSRPLALVPIHDSVERETFKLAYRLRELGHYCEVGFSGNLSKRMKKAAAMGCRAAILIGPDELARGEVMLKILDTSEQKAVRLELLEGELRQLTP